jgi:hypothetical protein
MKENKQCSILFHLLVPGGKWQTEICSPVSSASCCPFPQPHPCAIAAAGIGSDQEAFRFRVGRATHPAPPAPNALHCKGGRIVIHSHAHTADVTSQVVDSIGRHFTFVRLANLEIVNANLLGLTFGMLLSSRILEITHQFLFLVSTEITGSHCFR